MKSRKRKEDDCRKFVSERPTIEVMIGCQVYFPACFFEKCKRIYWPKGIISFPKLRYIITPTLSYIIHIEKKVFKKPMTNYKLQITDYRLPPQFPPRIFPTKIFLHSRALFLLYHFYTIRPKLFYMPLRQSR